MSRADVILRAERTGPGLTVYVLPNRKVCIISTTKENYLSIDATIIHRTKTETTRVFKYKEERWDDADLIREETVDANGRVTGTRYKEGSVDTRVDGTGKTTGTKKRC